MMPTLVQAQPGSARAIPESETPSRAFSPRVPRAAMVLVLGSAIAIGFLAASTSASSVAAAQADADLTRLLRAMALLKALLALAVVVALLWRLGERVSVPRFALYAIAAAAMVAGPGVIWGMVYVRTGAALLHGGLLVTILMLWRDPAVAAGLLRRIAMRASERTAFERR